MYEPRESRDGSHCHPRACATPLGTPAGTKIPPGSDGLCPVLTGCPHFCSSRSPPIAPRHFSLKKSCITQDGDLAVVAKGFCSCWQSSPLVSPSVGPCPALVAAGSCGELRKVADAPAALGDANYHTSVARGHVKPHHRHQSGRAGWTGEVRTSLSCDSGWPRAITGGTEGQCPKP